MPFACYPLRYATLRSSNPDISLIFVHSKCGMHICVVYDEHKLIHFQCIWFQSFPWFLCGCIRFWSVSYSLCAIWWMKIVHAFVHWYSSLLISIQLTIIYYSVALMAILLTRSMIKGFTCVNGNLENSNNLELKKTTRWSRD